MNVIAFISKRSPDLEQGGMFLTGKVAFLAALVFWQMRAGELIDGFFVDDGVQ